MTPKQKRFVELYDGNATAAAIQAGYSSKTARAAGQRLLTKVDIAAAIRTREEREARVRIATRQERQEFWTAVMRDGEAKMFDRLRASELLGKSEADFIDRQEITGWGGEPIVVKWGGE